MTIPAPPAVPMTFGSLFAGIGGMDLGLERAGMTCAWQVEIDPFARRVLEKHWPGVRRHDDVKTFPPTDPEDWRVDLICGGFPCQDISGAHTNGKRRGLDGFRSGLWSQFSRIVAGLLPRWVLVENSPEWGRWTHAICDDLFGQGYCPTPIEMEAASFGAPHARPRVFVVAHPYGDGESPCPFDAEASGLPSPSGFGRHWRESRPAFVGLADGLPAALVRRSYGNAVVPQVAEWIGLRILEAR